MITLRNYLRNTVKVVYTFHVLYINICLWSNCVVLCLCQQLEIVTNNYIQGFKFYNLYLTSCNTFQETAKWELWLGLQWKVMLRFTKVFCEKLVKYFQYCTLPPISTAMQRSPYILTQNVFIASDRSLNPFLKSALTPAVQYSITSFLSSLPSSLKSSIFSFFHLTKSLNWPAV